jgi:hypothetical protein
MMVYALGILSLGRKESVQLYKNYTPKYQSFPRAVPYKLPAIRDQEGKNMLYLTTNLPCKNYRPYQQHLRFIYLRVCLGFRALELPRKFCP